jgi:Flp pilus assembly protein TadG
LGGKIMLKCWRLFFYQKKASISIEFAIVFPFLFTLFVFMLELSRIMIIGSALDLMSTEMSREVAISKNTNYSQRMNALITSQVPLWPYITDPNDFHITLTFCNTIRDSINNSCQSTLSNDNHFISFNLQYNYRAMFPNMFSSILDSSLTKKVIVYREFYEN